MFTLSSSWNESTTELMKRLRLDQSVASSQQLPTVPLLSDAPPFYTEKVSMKIPKWLELICARGRSVLRRRPEQMPFVQARSSFHSQNLYIFKKRK
jgi:hypothetical protein